VPPFLLNTAATPAAMVSTTFAIDALARDSRVASSR
jgi:hypothetical protein